MKRAAVLRKIIAEKDMKVADVVKESGIAYSTVKSILENGVTKASYVNVWLICHTLGITTDDLEEMARDVNEDDEQVPLHISDKNESVFLHRLEDLMGSFGIKNLNELSEVSGVPYTTLRSFYVNGTDNIKLSTLNKLKRFFGCTLDYLVIDDITDRNYGLPPKEEKNTVVLQEDESDMLKIYNALSNENKIFLRGYAKALSDKQGE